MAETFTYDHTSIERYLQGKMTPPEMHAFEKAMLDDPFLADAMEGFQASDAMVAKKHLAIIEKKLNGEKLDAIVVPMATKGQNWLKVAAAVLIIVTGSIFSYQYLQKDIQTGTGQPLAKEQQSPIVTFADSISATENAATNPPVLSQPEIAYNKQKPAINANGNLTSEKLSRDENKFSADEMPALALKDDKKETEIAKAEIVKSKALAESKVMADDVYNNRQSSITNIPGISINEIKGNVTNSDGDPLPYVSIKAVDNNNNNVTTTSDSKGNFYLPIKDTNVIVSVSGVGYASTQKKLSGRSASNNIILKEESQSLSEVVVTGMSKKNKTGKPAENIVSISGEKIAEPVGGWKKFEEYIALNMDHFRDSMQKIDDELLYVEFELDNKGKPYDIKMKDKAQQEYAELANKLLQNGPRWRRIKNNEKVKLNLKLK